jgi:hypothetical protein
LKSNDTGERLRGKLDESLDSEMCKAQTVGNCNDLSSSFSYNLTNQNNKLVNNSSMSNLNDRRNQIDSTPQHSSATQQMPVSENYKMLKQQAEKFHS